MIRTLLDVNREARRPLLFVKVILVFLSIFTKSQASSHFEEMNSAQLSMCEKDVRPSVQKRWRTMAFSRVSTGNSVIPSSCEMKYEPAFKPLQGNPAFFESGHLGVHSTSGRKQRVPVTYLFLREGSS